MLFAVPRKETRHGSFHRSIVDELGAAFARLCAVAKMFVSRAVTGVFAGRFNIILGMALLRGKAA